MALASALVHHGDELLSSRAQHLSLPVLQSPSCRGTPMAKQAKSALPAPVHLADSPRLIRQIPSKQHHKPGSVQVAQTGATPLHSESCLWEKVI